MKEYLPRWKIVYEKPLKVGVFLGELLEKKLSWGEMFRVESWKEKLSRAEPFKNEPLKKLSIWKYFE